MKIQTVTTYRLDGQIFTSLRSAKEHVQNEIGKVIDSLPMRLSPKDALAVFKAIVANKERLRELLSVTVERVDDGVTTEDREENLLDLDL